MPSLVDPVGTPVDTRLRGQLAEAAEVADPLDRQAVLAAVQRSLFQGAEDPVRIGRFVVIDRLGTGASGVVYAAYDPKLDRKVALKVLRSDADLAREAHIRLLREAQSLARLSHPHVVAVHDVGDVDGRVFIAMELLRGGTLRAWAEAEPRRPSQVLHAYLQAGEGLAAAHAEGLVHRDFKPDNVLLDHQGRVRVVDFGLAREHGTSSTSMIEAVVTDEVPRLELDANLTRTGAVMGTPAYMAPEQFAGRPADARTDQYSFCVALYEALYGERPIDGDTLLELAAAVQVGMVRAAPQGRAVPARVRKALLRGLSPEPAKRFDDMPSLLHALAVDPWARRRRWGLASVGLAVLVGTTWVAAGGHEEPPQPCSGLQRRLDGTWDEPRREQLALALADSGHPDGAGVWARVEPELDDYAQAWVKARQQACEATEVHEEQSEKMFDRRARCLDRALLPLSAALDRLAEADVEIAMRAGELVPKHRLIEECSAQGVLDDGDPPPTDPARRAEIMELEARIAQVQSLRIAGRYRQALDEAQTLSEQTTNAEHPPTHARALRLWAEALSHARRPDDAIEVLVKAVAAAESGRADRTRAFANLMLVRRLSDTGKFEEARRLATVTEALYGRLLAPPPGVDAMVHMLWAHVEWNEGNYDEALARYDEALALSEGDPALAVHYAEAMGLRGTLALEAERHEEARDQLTRAVELRVDLDGPDHPELAVTLSNLGSAHMRLGELELAERMLRRSMDIRVRRLGPEHESLAPALSMLGGALMKRGQVEEGIAMQERALTLMERSLGPTNAELANPLHNLALGYLRAGKPALARTTVQRARQLRVEALGPTHPRAIASEYQVAYVESETGHKEEARQAYDRYVALLREHRPDDGRSLVMGLIGVADVAMAQGRPRDAQHAMEEAEPLVRDTTDHQLRLAVAVNYVRALHEQGVTGRASDHAKSALAQIPEDTTAKAERETLVQWLAEHPTE